MDEFDDDDFGDLYGDIEVQTSSAISSMHGMAQIIQGENFVPDYGAEVLNQFPMEISKNVILGEEQGNGLGEIEIAAGGDICGDEVVLREEDRGLITLPSEDCDAQGSEGEDEYDGGSDGNKQMLEVDYDVAGESSEGGKGMKNGHQSYGDSLSHQQYMRPQSAVFSSNSDDSYRGGTDLVDNDRKQLIDRSPVDGRDSSNSPIPQSRDSTHASAFPPPNFDKRGAVHISDSEEDNDAYSCDSDGIVELSRRGRSERDHHFSSSSSPSVEHCNNDKEQSRKRVKNNSSGPVTEVRRSASYNTKNGLYSERERTLVKKEVTQHERSNGMHNKSNCLNECVTPFGFDTRVPFNRHQWAINHGNQGAMFGNGPNWQNMPYCQAPETFFPYFGGFLPGGHLPPAYLNNHYWNIYSNIGYEASQLNAHNMGVNSNFLEKKTTEMDKAPKDKHNHTDRPVIENKALINVDDSSKFTPEYSHAPDKRGAQFSKRENDNQFKSSRKGGYMPPLRDHGGDFMKGKNRRFLPSSYRDRHCVDGRDDRISHDRREERHGKGNDRYHSVPKKSDNLSQLENGDNCKRFFKSQCVDHQDDRISHDRREVERHMRGNDRYHSPLKKSDNSSQVENGDNRRRFFRSHGFDHRDDRISHDRREVERHVRGNDRYHSPLKKSDNSLLLENEDNRRQYFKNQPSPFQSFKEPRALSGERFKGAVRPAERYFKGFSKERDTIKNHRYSEGREHLQERRHYQQHSNTFNSTGSIKFHHDKNDFYKRKHHQLSGVLHQDEKYKSRHPNKILHSEGLLFQSEKTSRTTRTDDRYTSDSVTGFIDRRDVENSTYKLERGGFSSHFDQGLRSARPDRSMLVRPQYPDPLGHSVVTEKSSRRTFEAKDVVHHSRNHSPARNDNWNSDYLNHVSPKKMDLCYEGKVHIKQADENLHKKSSENQQNKFLDIEEGQVIPEELVMQNKVEPASKDNLVADRLDDQKIQQIIAKMERRKERFKELVAVKCEPEKPLINLDVEITESEVKVERPARKRKWAGN